MRMPMIFGAITAVAVALLPLSAQAAAILPTSYDMPNGNSGNYNYWDQIYNGTGCVTCDNAALTGGVGDLTDGVIATDNWFVVEAPAGNGPYVGWTLNPLITFHFAPGTTIGSMTIYVDDTNGSGGVSTPAGVRINGGPVIPLVDPPSGTPTSYTFNGLNVTGNLDLEVLRGNSWVFMSEVQFDGESTQAAVPEPATLTLLGSAFAAIAARRRRKAGV
jgi:hypothetical protein